MSRHHIPVIVFLFLKANMDTIEIQIGGTAFPTLFPIQIVHILLLKQIRSDPLRVFFKTQIIRVFRDNVRNYCENNP